MKIDVVWPFSSGQTIALDHGYSLFGALCRVLPALHQDKGVSVAPVTGQWVAPQVLRLTPRSRLRIRVDAERADEFAALDGAVIEVDRHLLRLGKHTYAPLAPAADLTARSVVIRSGSIPHSGGEFWTPLARQLAVIVRRQDRVRVEVGRRVVTRVNAAITVGYQVDLHGLAPDDSLRVQSLGVGGRGHFGCGVFVPANAVGR